MGTSTREDIALMYGQFHMAKAQLGAKLLRLNKIKAGLYHRHYMLIILKNKDCI